MVYIFTHYIILTDMASSLRDRRSSKSDNVEITPYETVRIEPKSASSGASSTSSREKHGDKAHGVPEVLDMSLDSEDNVNGVERSAPVTWKQQLAIRRRTFFAYIKTRDFWTVLLLGCVAHPKMYQNLC